MLSSKGKKKKIYLYLIHQEKKIRRVNESDILAKSAHIGS